MGVRIPTYGHALSVSIVTGAIRIIAQASPLSIPQFAPRVCSHFVRTTTDATPSLDSIYCLSASLIRSANWQLPSSVQRVAPLGRRCTESVAPGIATGLRANACPCRFSRRLPVRPASCAKATVAKSKVTTATRMPTSTSAARNSSTRKVFAARDDGSIIISKASISIPV